jgi:hypothetical protein
MPRRIPMLLALALACGGGGACVGYRPAPLDVRRPLAAGVVVPSPLTFEDALRLAVERNPDLAALRARASAVNLNPAREPVEVGAGVDSDHRPEATASLDALSLLGLGTRRADRALAVARRAEALMAHHARAREIAGEIAEAFAVESALAGLTTPDLGADTEAYVRAGFETSVAEKAVEATKADWEAEVALRGAERRANRLVLARLLGLPPGVEAVPASVDAAWPPLAAPAPADLIRTRSDVQRRVAAFEVADFELRRAVFAQYPSVSLEPGLAADPASLFGAVRLRIPVGAGREVLALEASREAARSDVDAAVLDAIRDAGASAARHEAAVVARSSAERRLSASSELLRVGRARLQVSEGSVLEVVLAADAVLDAARGLRAAVLEETRTRVRAARDAGWPAPESPPESLPPSPGAVR